jgi:hypothetical protein
MVESSESVETPQDVQRGLIECHKGFRPTVVGLYMKRSTEGTKKNAGRPSYLLNRYAVTQADHHPMGVALEYYTVCSWRFVSACGADQAGDIRSKHLGLPVASIIRSTLSSVKPFFAFGKYSYERLDQQQRLRIMVV